MRLDPGLRAAWEGKCPLPWGDEPEYRAGQPVRCLQAMAFVGI